MQDVDRLRKALADRYLVEDELGRGGMACVYRAVDIRHSRHVALKVVRQELVDRVGRERFLREIRITASLAHPHIRPLLDSGKVDGTLFYVMPLVDGVSVSDRIDDEGPLAVNEAVRLAREVADALEYAHAQGFVHRDVKPSNILMEAGHAVLTDFGVALPRSEAGTGRLTRSGIWMGTVEYMSPEQCVGRDEVDARSDVYSLGCVLHQMLGGRPPFTGKTPAAVLKRQLSDPPEPLRTLRPDVPAPVESVVLRALHKDPEERYQSAAGMRDALGAWEASRAVTASGSLRMRLAGAALGIVLLLAVTSPLWVRKAPELDPDRYAVLPFVQEDSSQVGHVDGTRCQAKLREALTRWEDVQLADPISLRDRHLRRDGRGTTVEDALADAASQRAGRMIWGRMWHEGDTTHVEGRLYDVASGATLRSYLMAFGPDVPAGPLFVEMADSLLVSQIQSPLARVSASGTRSFEALRLFEDGQRHLDTWALSEAAEAFSAAVERDPSYAHASLWRSLVGLFRGEDFEDWRRYAAAAAREEERFSARERLLARGLSHLSEERWQESCDAFDQAVAQDSLFFDAWLGLATCRARDPIVVRDPASESGVSFRSSHESGRRALRRALNLAPSYNQVLTGIPGSPLDLLLTTREGDFRHGHLDGDPSAGFGAHPELRADSVAHVPRPMDEFRAAAFTSEVVAAIVHNRRELSGITANWLDAFPEGLAALRSHALALEAEGRLPETGDPLTSALDAIRRAREVAPADSAQAMHVELAAIHARLLVKQGRWSAAGALADSVLAGPIPERPVALRTLAGLAVLRGRGAQGATLMALTAAEAEFWDVGRPIAVAIPLAETGLALLSRASLGGPEQVISDLLAQARTRLESLVPAPERARVARALLSPSLQGYPQALVELPDFTASPGNYLIPLSQALQAGDSAGVREGLAAAAADAANLATGGTPPSIALADARLRVAVGDTTGAVAELDRMLGSLRMQDRRLLDPSEAGPLVRAMALRAELAAVRGRPEDASVWAEAVVSLWSDADPFAASRAEAMRRLIDRRGGF